MLLRPHVRRKDIEGGSLWNGFGLEFELDREGHIVHLGKDGLNAGVCANARYYPATDTTVVTLANIEHDVRDALFHAG